MDEKRMEGREKTPKVDWLLRRVVSGSTLAFGNEDTEFWKNHPLGVKLTTNPNEILDPLSDTQADHFKVIMLGEILQRVEDPQQTLQNATKIGDTVVLVVPNEHGWDAVFKPMSNKKHLRFYDCESLCRELEKAGMSYLIELIDFGGWSFLVADAQKVRN